MNRQRLPPRPPLWIGKHCRGRAINASSRYDLGRKHSVFLVCSAARWSKRFLDKRVPGRTDYAAVIVEHNLDWHVLEQRLHTPFTQERLDKYRLFHLGNDFCSDTAADENAAGGHEIQGAVSSFCTKHADENRQSLIADRSL